MSANTTVVAAKLPVTLAARLTELARRRRVTPSLLIRRLIELELDADGGREPGPIESTTRARLEELIGDELDPRAVVACELARRLDVDPSNGAQHSRELSRLLDEIEVSHGDELVTPFDAVRARRLLRTAGYGLVTPEGDWLCEPDPAAAAVNEATVATWRRSQARRFPTREEMN